MKTIEIKRYTSQFLDFITGKKNTIDSIFNQNEVIGRLEIV